MEMRVVELPELPPGVSPERFLEEQQREAVKRELKVLGPRSRKLVTELETLESARAERLAQEEQLAEELAGKSGALNKLRAVALIEEVDQDQVANLESEVMRLQSELNEVRGIIAGLDALLYEKREALEPAQLEDVEEAVEKSAKALAKTCKAFLQTLETGAKAMQEAGLMKERERWQTLIEQRHQLLYELYDLIPSSDDKADRQIRAELMTTYNLFGGVPNVVLELASCLVDLFEVREGKPRVRQK